ncbi:hypothetical protein ILYODFUR_003909 [Ilyodon furcidens]|uniref:Uncharacterized protein n=1 Tax=Ilyodon furcidens TaxID=33524 RepID=A0ABV0V2X3_9TELE
MIVILGSRGILTALGQHSVPVTAGQRVSLPRLKNTSRPVSRRLWRIISSNSATISAGSEIGRRAGAQCPAINPANQLTGRRETKKQAFSSQDELTPGKEEEIGKDGAVWTVVGKEESRGRRQSQNTLTERQIQDAQTAFL